MWIFVITWTRSLRRKIVPTILNRSGWPAGHLLFSFIAEWIYPVCYMWNCPFPCYQHPHTHHAWHIYRVYRSFKNQFFIRQRNDEKKLSENAGNERHSSSVQSMRQAKIFTGWITPFIRRSKHRCTDNLLNTTDNCDGIKCETQESEMNGEYRKKNAGKQWN